MIGYRTPDEAFGWPPRNWMMCQPALRAPTAILIAGVHWSWHAADQLADAGLQPTPNGVI
jgi:hypothetical protein